MLFSKQECLHASPEKKKKITLCTHYKQTLTDDEKEKRKPGNQSRRDA
jgi:hypothetical protein